MQHKQQRPDSTAGLALTLGRLQVQDAGVRKENFSMNTRKINMGSILFTIQRLFILSKNKCEAVYSIFYRKMHNAIENLGNGIHLFQ